MQLHGVTAPGADRVAREWLERLGLADRCEEKLEGLSHGNQLELVERICRRVEVLEDGRRLAGGTLAELRARFPARLRVKVAAPSDWARGLPGARLERADEDGVVLVVDPGLDVQSVLRAAQAAGKVIGIGACGLGQLTAAAGPAPSSPATARLAGRIYAGALVRGAPGWGGAPPPGRRGRREVAPYIWGELERCA